MEIDAVADAFVAARAARADGYGAAAIESTNLRVRALTEL
jgi:hypothetical protein